MGAFFASVRRVAIAVLFLSSNLLLGADSVTTARAVVAPAVTVGGTPSALGPVDQLTAQPPFLVTTLSYLGDTGISASITGTWQAEYYLDAPHNVPIGPPGNPVATENNSISEGYLAFSGSAGWLKLGRQPISLGPSRLSNLQVSRTIPFLDAILYHVSLGDWSLTHAIATLENRRGRDDLALAFSRPGYGFGDSIILLSTRRFVWSHNNARLGIGAQAILTRDYNAFQLGDVLPVYSVHNGDPGKNNLFVSLDGELLLRDHVVVYGIVGFDDIDAGIVGISDGPVPTIWAAVFGIKSEPTVPSVHARTEPEATRGHLDYDLEVGYTHPLWGSFDDDYPLSRSIYRLRADAPFAVMPLTSPYGPSRLWLRVVGSVSPLPGFVLAPDILLLGGDPGVDLVSLPYVDVDASLSFLLARFSLSGRWSPVPSVSLEFVPAVDFTPDGTDLRATLSAIWRYELTVSSDDD